MNWTEFLQILALLYGLYYAILIGIDNFRTGQNKSKKEQALVLSFATEQPKDVSLSSAPAASNATSTEPPLPPPTPAPATRKWIDDLPLLDPMDDEDDYDDMDDRLVGESNPQSTPLSSGITDFSGAIGIEELLEQIDEQRVDIVQKIYTKYAGHEKQQTTTPTVAT